MSDHNLYSKTILKNTFSNTNRLLNSNKPEPKKNGYPKELDFSKNNIRTVPLHKPYIIPSQTYPSKFNEFINKIKTPQQINYKKVKKSDKSNLTNSNKYNKNFFFIFIELNFQKAIHLITIGLGLGIKFF